MYHYDVLLFRYFLLKPIYIVDLDTPISCDVSPSFPISRGPYQFFSFCQTSLPLFRHSFTGARPVGGSLTSPVSLTFNM